MKDEYVPFKFYAWQSKSKLISIEAPSRLGYVCIDPSEISYPKLRSFLINAEEYADFVSVSTFTKAITNTRNPIKTKDNLIIKKSTNNIYSIRYCFVDIDSQLVLSQEIILQRCRAYEIPNPTYIINTSKSHYQCIWELKDELTLENEKLLNYWKIIQKSLHNLFSDLGADSYLCDNPAYYIRNPNKALTYNFKYPELPQVTKSKKGKTIKLSSIYYPLKNKKEIIYE